MRRETLARAAIDAGASAVIGSHPHVLHRGIGEGVVLYSLGTFVFDLDPDNWATLGPGPFQTAVAVITLRRDGRRASSGGRP